MDARPGRDPPLRDRLHLLQTPGDHARGRGEGQRPTHPRRRPGVLLAVPLPQRRDRDRPARRAPGPARGCSRSPHRRTASSTATGSRPRRQVRRDPGADDGDGVSGGRPGISKASAPSSAASSTRRCSRRSKCCRPRNSTPGWRTKRGARRPAPPSSASRSSRASARSATGRTGKGSSGRPSRRRTPPTLSGRAGGPQWAREDAHGRRGVGRPPDEGAHRLPQRPVRRGGGF